eukprot:TRINITY_DN6511_c0_g1_i1.p1 TRINITY_DN6511_c0_g1~~TRINITY_DN6511_c0_g1_i1.p1  ORF type:complete len:116 (+),score=14.52 TRINITY_DN6511_c0_g1_i1:91-438(+)
MGEEIWIYRAGREDVHIPTDCEGPIGAGMIVGDWQVTSGYSRFGGNICSYRPDQYDGALNERDEGRTVRGEQEGASPDPADEDDDGRGRQGRTTRTERKKLYKTKEDTTLIRFLD